MSAEPRATTLSERAALIAFLLFTLTAVAGYAVFGRNPQLLRQFPEAIGTYSLAFMFFPRAHVILAALVLAFVLVRHAGARWIPAFLALYVISLVSELAGTTVGLPFGPYSYTDGLGVKLFGHVPALIPVSWFFMAVPSYVLAVRALTRGGRAPRAIPGILLGSLVLLAWDLALDPAMSWITKYWVWGTDGAYYGMPLLNLFGWYVTGLALMAALGALRAGEWTRTIPTPWLLSFYLVNLALPLGMIIAAGLWGAAALTGVGAAASLAAPRFLAFPRASRAAVPTMSRPR